MNYPVDVKLLEVSGCAIEKIMHMILEQNKARLVTPGFLQKHGVDYDEIFHPVVRLGSVQTVIALAAKHDQELHQLDITSALINGKLKEIYMKQPEGFEIKEKTLTVS